MPRGIPNKKPFTKRRRKGLGLADTKPERHVSSINLMSMIATALSDIAAERGTLLDPKRWSMVGEGALQASIAQGPTLALLQERIGLSIDQARKQFDRLSQIGDRICGPGTPPMGDDGRNEPQPGGMIATLNGQMNAVDQIMARIDDQITRLESL